MKTWILTEAALKSKTWFKIIIILFPFVSLGLVYLFRNQLSNFGNLLPGCPSYSYLHILCPGCGNTRSVQHLLSGDLLGSIKYNPVPAFGLIISALGYMEFVLRIFLNPVKILPRSKVYWICVAVILIIYFIVRNFIRIF